MGKQKGFSYTETLIALAVLCIALLPVYPALAAARRNDEYARSRYKAQLYADELVWAVRQALWDGTSPEDAARIRAVEMDEPGFTYGCWVWPCDSSLGAGISFYSPNRGDEPPFSADRLIIRSDVYTGMNTRFIAVAVWDDEDRLAGRAAGVAP